MKNKLKEHLENNGFVYQFADELVEVCGTGPDPSRILETIDKSESIKRVEKEPMRDLGFMEIAAWSQDSDAMYLIDDLLIINVGPDDL